MEETQKEGGSPTPGIMRDEDSLKQAREEAAPGGPQENRIYYAGATTTLERGTPPTPEEELAWVAENILAQEGAFLNPLEAAHLFNIVSDLLSEERRDLPGVPDSRSKKTKDLLEKRLAVVASADNVDPGYDYATGEQTLGEKLTTLDEVGREQLEVAVGETKRLISKSPNIESGVPGLVAENLDTIFGQAKSE